MIKLSDSWCKGICFSSSAVQILSTVQSLLQRYKATAIMFGQTNTEQYATQIIWRHASK
jgi:hypothetical protein